MANEFDEYEEIEAAEDTAWKPEHDFTIFAEEAESSDAIPFDEDLGAALGAEFETVLESQLEQDEDPTGIDDDIPEDEDDPDAPIGFDTLRQQIDEFAVERLSKAARKDTDFDVVIGEMDRLDRNRERRERYHEVLRGDVPLDVGIAKNPHIFPEWLGTPVAQQMRSGNYLDWLANCPYEMHDLLANAVLSSLIYSLKEDHKENFYYSAIQLLQSQEVAKLMGQSTRNIRKKRNVILRKLRAGWYEHLRSKPAGSLSLDEKDFLRKYKKTAPDGFGSGKEVCYEAAV